MGGEPVYRSLFYVENKHYYLGANYIQENEFKSILGFEIDKVNDKGVYNLHKYGVSHGYYRDYGKGNPFITYYTDSLSNPESNKVTVTYFDPEKKIISGTFEFTGTAENGDTVRISNGRFDVPFEYRN